VNRLSPSSGAWVVLFLAVVGWAALVVSAPLLGRRALGGGLGVMAASAGYLTGGMVCHQRPERSFHLAGAQLPVCGRCTGLYVSAAAGVLLAWRWPRAKRNPARHLLLAALPSAATFALEWSGTWPVSNVVRSVAAVPLGLAVGALLVEAAGFRGRL